MTVSLQSPQALLLYAVAATFVSWLWFSAYHFMQLRTAPLFKNHMNRSILWTVAFLLCLPLLLFPLAIALSMLAQLNPSIVSEPTFPGISFFLVLGSTLLGWMLSYYPQRARLREIGAWGWPQKQEGRQ